MNKTVLEKLGLTNDEANGLIQRFHFLRELSMAAAQLSATVQDEVAMGLAQSDAAGITSEDNQHATAAFCYGYVMAMVTPKCMTAMQNELAQRCGERYEAFKNEIAEKGVDSILAENKAAHQETVQQSQQPTEVDDKDAEWYKKLFGSN